jgi:transposase-like protein
MTKSRRSFTDEIKLEAVKLVKYPGAKVTHIARDLGINQSVLRHRVEQEHSVVLDMLPSRPHGIPSKVGLLVLAPEGHEAQLAQALQQFTDLIALTMLLAPPKGVGTAIAAIVACQKSSSASDSTAGSAAEMRSQSAATSGSSHSPQYVAKACLRRLSRSPNTSSR